MPHHPSHASATFPTIHPSSPQVSTSPTDLPTNFSFLVFSPRLTNEQAMGGPSLLYHGQEKLNQWQPVCFFYLTNSTPDLHTLTKTTVIKQAPYIHSPAATSTVPHTLPDHILTSLPPTLSHTTHPQTHLTDFISCEAWVRRLQCIYRSNTWLLAILII